MEVQRRDSIITRDYNKFSSKQIKPKNIERTIHNQLNPVLRPHEVSPTGEHGNTFFCLNSEVYCW